MGKILYIISILLTILLGLFLVTLIIMELTNNSSMGGWNNFGKFIAVVILSWIITILAISFDN